MTTFFVVLLALVVFGWYMRTTPAIWNPLSEFFARKHVKIYCGILSAMLADQFYTNFRHAPCLAAAIASFIFGVIFMILALHWTGQLAAMKAYNDSKAST